MSDPELQLREHIQRLQNRVGELEAALKATKAAVVNTGETAVKAIERLAELEPLIQAAIAWAKDTHDARPLDAEIDLELARRAART